MKRWAGLIVMGAILAAFCASAVRGADKKLAYDKTENAKIATNKGTDTWTFDAEPGNTILLRAVAPDAKSYRLQITVQNSENGVEADETENPLIACVLQGTGPYRIVVTRHDIYPERTTYLAADYAITLFNLSTGAGDSISCGATLEDCNLPGTEMDVLEFDGKPGDRILLSAMGNDVRDRLRITLYNSGNILELDETDTGLIEHVLEGEKPYRLVVVRCDDELAQDAQYDITLFNLGSCAGTAISYGTTLPDRSLPWTGIGVFTFSGKAEDKVRLSAVAATSDCELQILLYDSKGVVKRDTSASCQINHMLKHDGPYQIVVTDQLGRPATYAMRLECTECTLTLSSAGAGSVTPGAGKHTYPWGQQVRVTASWDACHSFAGWTGTAAEQLARRDFNDITIKVQESCTLTANFTTQTSYLTTSCTGGGMMVVTPGGTIGSGEAKVFTYDCGATVKVKAQPDAYHHFAGWPAELGTIDPGDPSGRTLAVTVVANVTLASIFKPNALQLVSSAGGSIEFPDGRPVAFDSSMPVRIAARPDACYQFTHWSGTAVQAGKVANVNEAQTTVTVDGDYTLFATFDPDKDKTLTISVGPGGTVTAPGEGTFVYNCGESVLIAAAGDECHKFARWTGTAVDAGKVAEAGAPSTTVVLDRDYTLQANFKQYVMPPQVKTLDAEDVTSISARLGGTLISDGNGICEWRFRYGRAGQETSDYTDWRAEPKTGTAFKKLVENLAPETAYCFEAEARNCAGSAKGGEFCFTTPPTVKLALASSAGGRIVEPNMPRVELPIPADVNVVAEAAPDRFFWLWQGTAVDSGKLLTAVTDPNARVLVDANDTLRAVFLRWITDWEDDVDRGECRSAVYSTSQIWDFADAAGDVNGIPENVFDILGTASGARPPLPGTVLKCEDPNWAAALRWWPTDPYGPSGRRGMVAASGLHATIHIPPTPTGASIWVQVIWREFHDAESGFFAPDASPGPVLVDVEPFLQWSCLAELYLPDGWRRTTYGWFVDPNTEKISFTITGAAIMDCLIVDTCRESANRWLQP